MGMKQSNRLEAKADTRYAEGLARDDSRYNDRMNQIDDQLDFRKDQYRQNIDYKNKESQRLEYNRMEAVDIEADRYRTRQGLIASETAKRDSRAERTFQVGLIKQISAARPKYITSPDGSRVFHEGDPGALKSLLRIQQGSRNAARGLATSPSTAAVNQNRQSEILFSVDGADPRTVAATPDLVGSSYADSINYGEGTEEFDRIKNAVANGEQVSMDVSFPGQKGALETEPLDFSDGGIESDFDNADWDAGPDTYLGDDYDGTPDAPQPFPEPAEAAKSAEVGPYPKVTEYETQNFNQGIEDVASGKTESALIGGVMYAKIGDSDLLKNDQGTIFERRGNSLMALKTSIVDGMEIATKKNKDTVDIGPAPFKVGNFASFETAMIAELDRAWGISGLGDGDEIDIAKMQDINSRAAYAIGRATGQSKAVFTGDARIDLDDITDDWVARKKEMGVTFKDSAGTLARRGIRPSGTDRALEKAHSIIGDDIQKEIRKNFKPFKDDVPVEERRIMAEDYFADNIESKTDITPITRWVQVLAEQFGYDLNKRGTYSAANDIAEEKTIKAIEAGILDVAHIKGYDDVSEDDTDVQKARKERQRNEQAEMRKTYDAAVKRNEAVRASPKHRKAEQKTFRSSMTSFR
jgi:hypothetical protein